MSAVWEVINPSDPVTVKGDDFAVVAAAMCFLGKGKYSAVEVHNDVVASSVERPEPREVPFFLFGGVDEWFQSNFGVLSFAACLDAMDKEEIAKVLDSAVVGNASERMRYEMLVNEYETDEQKEGFRKTYHDREVTSMNDICGRAWAIAQRIREVNSK